MSNETLCQERRQGDGPVKAMRGFVMAALCMLAILCVLILKPPVQAHAATSSTVDAGDTITYSIAQTVNTFYGDTFTYYSGMVFRDQLPAEVTYQSARLMKGGVDVTGTYGTLNYNAGTRTVTYTMSNSILQNTGFYDGSTYTLIITAKANKQASPTVQAHNTGHVDISGIDFTTNTVTTTIRTPVLSVVKDADKSEYGPLDTVRYTVKITNTTAGSTADNVVVTDTLPDGLTLNGQPQVSGVAGTASASGNSFTVRIPALTSGQTATITFNCTATGLKFGNITNTASASADNADSKSGSDTIKILKPVLEITKNADGTRYGPRDTVTYTFTVKNTTAGTSDFNVFLFDIMPESLTVMADPVVTGVSGATVMHDDNSFSVKIPKLTYGQTATVTLKCQVNGSAYGNVTNTAAVYGDFGDRKTASKMVTLVKPVLEVTKDANATRYGPQDTVTYTITVRNVTEGCSDYDVVVSDTVPKGLTLNGDPSLAGVAGTPSHDGNSFTVRIPKLTYGETATITVNCTVDGGAYGSIQNTAKAKGAYSDEKSGSDTITVVRPELTATKTADKRYYNPGDTVHFTATLAQEIEGISDFNVTFKDTVPQGLEITGEPQVSGVDGARVEHDTTNLTVTVPKLSDGQTLTVTFDCVVRAASGVQISNRIHGGGTYSNGCNAEADIVTIPAGLTIFKEADKTRYGLYDTVHYTVTVEQFMEQGVEGMKAYNVVVTDTIPAGMKLVGNVTLQGAAGTVQTTGNSYTVTIPELDYGVEAKILFDCVPVYDELVFDSDQDNIAEVTNKARAEALRTDPVESSARIEVIRPVVEVEKAADKQYYTPDEPITYTINVNQTVRGTSAKNVVVSDTLPAGMHLDSVTSTMEGLEISSADNGFNATIGTLDYGTEVVFTAKCHADDTLIGKDAQNTVTAIPEDGISDTATETVKVDVPELSVVKTVAGGPYIYGEKIPFTVTVAQKEEDKSMGLTCKNIQIADTEFTKGLVPDIDSVQVSMQSATVNPDGKGGFTVSVPQMAPSDTLTITFNADIDPAALTGYQITNKATVTQDHGKPAEDSADTEIYFKIETDIDHGTITGEDDRVVRGDDRKVTWEPEAGWYVTSVVVDGEPMYEGNDANEFPTECEFNDVAKNHKVAVKTRKAPNLIITKTTDALEYTYPGPVTYTISVEQTVEDAVADKVVITDQDLTPGMTLDPASIQVDCGVAYDLQPATDGFLLTLDELPYGVPVTVTVQGWVDSETLSTKDIKNTAVASCEQLDPVTDDAEISIYYRIDTEVVNGTITPTDGRIVRGENRTVEYAPNPGYYLEDVVIDGNHVDLQDYHDLTEFKDISRNHTVKVVYGKIPELAVDKQTDKSGFHSGDRVKYTITVEETVEDAVARNVTVYDFSLPNGILIDQGTLSCTADSYDFVGGTGNGFELHIDEIAYGSPVTVTFEAEVDSELLDSSDISNTATASWNNSPDANGTAQDDAKIKVTEPVTTEVVNGTITPGNEDVEIGSDVLVEYEPNDGFYLDSIVVDGEDIPLDENRDQYLFGDVHGPHHIKVVYEKIPALKLEKKTDKTGYGTGDTILYTLTVTETVEDAIARNVTISDVSLPDGVKVDTESITCSDEGAEITPKKNGFSIKVGQIPYGEPVTVTFKAAVDGKLLEGSSVVNTATAAWDNAPDASGKTQDDAEVRVSDPIITEVVNGKITPSIDDVEIGSDVTVKYEPNDGFYLDSIEVDGKNVSLEEYADNYLFGNVHGPHSIKVVYRPMPALELKKECDSSTYNRLDTAHFTLHLAQTVEGAVARNVVVTDRTMNGGLKYLPDSLAVSGVKEDRYTAVNDVEGFDITLEKLEYGEQMTVEFDAIVLQDSEEIVTNSATAICSHILGNKEAGASVAALVTNPVIDTVALGSDGSHAADPGTQTQIRDAVAYGNLSVGKQYTLVGIAMDASTGEPIKIGGEAVTSETEFTTEKSSGSAEVVFSFDTSAYTGKDVVIFEKLYNSNGELVAEHVDINDKDQTVSIRNPEQPVIVQTGDSFTKILRMAVLSAVALAAGFVLIRGNRKRARS